MEATPSEILTETAGRKRFKLYVDKRVTALAMPTPYHYEAEVVAAAVKTGWCPEPDTYSESFDSEPCFTAMTVYAVTKCDGAVLREVLTKIDLRALLPSAFLMEGDMFDPEVIRRIYEQADARNVAIVTPMAVCACMTRGDVRMLKDIVKRGVSERGGDKEAFLDEVMQVIDSDVSYVRGKSMLSGFLAEGFVAAMPGMARMLLGLAVCE